MTRMVKYMRITKKASLTGISKLAILAVTGSLSMSVAGSSVFASLDATAFNTTPQTVSSGTLKLFGTDNGAAFTSAISLLVPGDVTNRYVNYQNSGTLDAQALTLSIADTGSSLLTTDGTKGLQVTVSSCPSPGWVASTGACTGGATVRLISTSLLSLKTLPGSIFAGPMVALSWQYLQFSITFPAATETTINGVLPGSTVQGLSASITWTLREVQRSAVTTNS